MISLVVSYNIKINNSFCVAFRVLFSLRSYNCFFILKSFIKYIKDLKSISVGGISK